MWVAGRWRDTVWALLAVWSAKLSTLDSRLARRVLQGAGGEGMEPSSEEKTAPMAAREPEQPEPELNLSMLPMECLLHVLSWCSLCDLMQCRAVDRVLKVRAAPPTIPALPVQVSKLVQDCDMCPASSSSLELRIHG